MQICVTRAVPDSSYIAFDLIETIGINYVIFTIGMQNSRKTMVAEFHIILSREQLHSVNYRI